ncbi:MAG: HEAT repeat domain-containing protein [bacterium]
MDVDGLLRQLIQGEADARVDAAALLAESGDRRALGALVRVLQDPDAALRAQACESLGCSGGRPRHPAAGEPPARPEGGGAGERARRCLHRAGAGQQPPGLPRRGSALAEPRC